MEIFAAPATSMVLFEIDRRCKICVVPYRIMAEIGLWTEPTHGPATPGAIEEVIEKQCGNCLDSCLVEPTATGFTLSIAALDTTGDDNDI